MSRSEKLEPRSEAAPREPPELPFVHERCGTVTPQRQAPFMRCEACASWFEGGEFRES